MLIAAFNHVGRRAIYYGCDLDPFVYRIALINMAIYNIPAYILRADSLKHDLHLDSPNWLEANTWTPPGLSTLSRNRVKELKALANDG